jgi:hypothetical protein
VTWINLQSHLCFVVQFVLFFFFFCLSILYGFSCKIMLFFFITNFLFVFSSLGYLYFFNMFRWDAHLVVTYSANCRGVPLPFHCGVCICVHVYLYICLFSKLFPLDIADGEVTVFSQLIIHHHTRKWNFFFN